MVQPFEVELLSDVEGEGWSRGDGGGDGATASSGNINNDKPWMRNIWSVQNRAVVMSYFCVGFAMRFLNTPLAYYTVEYLGDWTEKQAGLRLELSPVPKNNGWMGALACV